MSVIVPSSKLAHYVSYSYAILDYVEDIVRKERVSEGHVAFTRIFREFAPKVDICCAKYVNWGLKFVSKILINTGNMG